MLELCANQRSFVQLFSSHVLNLDLFIESIKLNADQIIVVKKTNWNTLIASLHQMSNKITFLMNRANTVFNKHKETFGDLQSHLVTCFSNFQSQVLDLKISKNVTSFLFISESTEGMLQIAIKEAISVLNCISEIRTHQPSFNYITKGFFDVCLHHTQEINEFNQSLYDAMDKPINSDTRTTESCSNIVTHMLLAVQHFNTILTPTLIEEEAVDFNSLVKSVNLKCLLTLNELISNFDPIIPSSIQEIQKLHTLYQSAYHFTLNYHKVVHQVWCQFIQNSKASYKLAYILLNVYKFMTKHGYNIPAGHEDTEEEHDTPADGLGLSDGTAENMAKDDIDDIDFEDGMTQDTSEPQEDLGEDKNEGIDVEHDFDSKVEDVTTPKDEEDNTDQDSAKDEEEQSDGNMDEEMQDLDGEGDVLDEKLWDNKEKEGPEKFENDKGIDAKEQESETVAANEDQETPMQEKDLEKGIDEEMQEVHSSFFISSHIL